MTKFVLLLSAEQSYLFFDLDLVFHILAASIFLVVETRLGIICF